MKIISINKYKQEDNALKIYVIQDPAIIRKLLWKRRIDFTFDDKRHQKVKKGYSKQEFPN